MNKNLFTEMNKKERKKMVNLINGDSLEILEKMNDEFDLIYLDPPFDTGRDFKYSKKSTNIEFTDKWIGTEYEEWLDKLISLCKKRLKKDGNLFFHISAELSLTPSIVLNRHFKKVEPIFWKKAHGKNTVKKKLGSVIDIIFKASENNSYFNLLYEPLDKYYFENSYKNKDSRGYYALGSLVHDKSRGGYDFDVKKDGVVYKAPYGWKKNKKEINRLIKEGRIHFAKKYNGHAPRIYKKLYKHECKGKPMSNLWTDISYITRTTKDERLYPTQKPLQLLERIIEMGCKNNGKVLDPVAGSGTTGVAALNKKRSVTLIDINKKSIEIIKKRLDI